MHLFLEWICLVRVARALDRLNRNDGFCINSYDEGEGAGSCMGRRRSAGDLARRSRHACVHTHGGEPNLGARLGISVPDWEKVCMKAGSGNAAGGWEIGRETGKSKKWGLQERNSCGCPTL